MSVQHVPGTLKELIAGGHRKELSASLWPQVCGYVLERREGEAARKQALAIYKNMTGAWPMGDFDPAKAIPPCSEVRSRIRSEQIRFANRRPSGESRAAA